MPLNAYRVPARIAALARSIASQSGAQSGQNVNVSWKGSSWPARIKEIDHNRFKVLVQYDGWSEKWNEWLSCGSSDVDIHSLSQLSPDACPPQNGLTRSVVELQIGGRSFKSANLADGRTVFQDKDTGILSWSPTLTLSPHTSNDISPSSQPEIPEGWIVRHDTKGSEYYFNTINWRAQWERPRLSAADVTINMKRVMEPIPAGWEVYHDRDGYPYYYNSETRETVWELPNTSDRDHSTQQATPDNQYDSFPEGWEIYFTEEGVPYFYCKATNTSHWELPEGVGSLGMDLSLSTSTPFEDIDPKPVIHKSVRKKKTKKQLVN